MSVHTKKRSGIFVSLDDDLLGLVINKVKRERDRKSFSEVCKQWFRVEGLDRSKLIIYVNDPGYSVSGLTRFPNIVTLWLFACSTHPDLEIIAQTCHKIKSIMIECRDEKQTGDGGVLSPKGLCALGEGCPKLTHVEILGLNAIGDSGVVELVHSAHNLESVVLRNNRLMSDEALRGIGSTSSISNLQLSGCDNITDEGLAFLANGSTSKTLKKLVFEGCSKITDIGVDLLRKMCSLERLKISSYATHSQITDVGGLGISAIRTLKVLWLNKVDVSDPTMVALAQNSRNLEKLDIGGCKKVTGAGIRAFCSHKCLKLLKLGSLKINLSDVELVVFGCPSLDSVIVDSHRSSDPTWSDELMQDRTRKVVKFVDCPQCSCFLNASEKSMCNVF